MYTLNNFFVELRNYIGNVKFKQPYLDENKSYNHELKFI